MKRRLLELLVRRYKNTQYQKPRDEWFREILTGAVLVEGHVERDPKAPVDDTADIAFCGVEGYVSRAGSKLAHALDAFDIGVMDLVVLDAGASTGGFTDCLLQRGARAVHAVDVGYNQLAYSLRSDPHVVVHERTNIMDVATLEPPADFAVMDLSFRSLRRAAAHAAGLTRQRRVVALVKPQFELAAEMRVAHRTPDDDGASPADEFAGVIRDEAEQQRVLDTTLRDLGREGLFCLKQTESPIAGRHGNREYLVYLFL